MCTSPLWIRRRGNDSGLVFEPSPLKSGLSVVADDGIRGWYVPCGKCSECVKRRKNDWFVRVVKELTYCYRRFKDSSVPRAFMVTFTFNEDSLPADRKGLSASIRRFKDNLRKQLGYSPLHWLVTERGEDTHRLHLHGVILLKGFTDFNLVRNCWKFGYSWIEDLKGFKGISYCMKYAFKGLAERYLYDDDLSGLVYCSHGFGSSYLDKSSLAYIFGSSNYSYTRILCLAEAGNYRYAVPRYYIKKACQFFGAVKYQDADSWLKSIEEVESSIKPPNMLYSVYHSLVNSFNPNIRKHLNYV